MSEQKRIPSELPVIYIDNTVMFPHLLFPLIITDENLKAVIDYALSHDKLLGFFLAKETNDDNDLEINTFGTAVSILRMLRNQDGSISLLLQGVSRIKSDSVIQKDPFIKVKVTAIAEKPDDNSQIQALKKVSVELLEKFVTEGTDINKELLYGLKAVKQPGRIADIIAGNLPFKVQLKQQILETIDINQRFKKLNSFLADLIKQMRLENRIRNNIQLEMDEDQRKYFLHEQLEAIRKELGEFDENPEQSKWAKKVADAKLPDYVIEAATEELKRMATMSPGSAEFNVIVNYIGWLTDLPWLEHTEDRLDLDKIQTIFDKDHYGLKKAKERIVEYIAVKKLKKQLKGPILCFYGPPGVGKTSLGKSVARALNRKFIRLSLGGIHDEAEIRGHRRTYIGAMPGRIISELKRAGSSNPVFMLDEIDKVGKDFRGDPSSALLEVLDPEQNSTFMDNYLNLHYNLSDIMFITTSNSLDTIPPALRDRMEIIEFSSYLEEEKIHIARDYLIPKEMDNNGLTGKHIRFAKSGLQEIIRHYVREAGVRNLQREIANVMRKVAKQVATGNESLNVITKKNVKDYLGRRKITHELANRQPEVGVVTGLAWTMFGGEILFCETTSLPGKGSLILTGLLGDVMKESARIALSHIKANAKKYKIPEKAFDNKDIHIHFPAGAIPKDGPSAGVTLTTAIISLLSNKKVKHDIAMTGEITLLGKVLPIGGVREKILAAKRAGISMVLLPFENQDSYDEIDAEIKEGLKVKFCKKIQDVLDEVLI